MLMRGFIYLIILSATLFCKQTLAYETLHLKLNTYSQTQNITNKKQQTCINDNSPLLIIEDTDLDLKDEFQGGNLLNSNVKNSFTTKTFLSNSYLFLQSTRLESLKIHNNYFKSNPTFCPNSNPIYIVIGVFKI